MTRNFILLALAALPLHAAWAQTTPVRSMYLDFGVDDGTNGNATPSPDANGTYWNNIFNKTGLNDAFVLVDQANGATGAKLTVGANFLTNGIKTGGLLAPDAALLGPYAVATATQDYFFVQGTGATSTATVRLSGLDQTKRYVFHVFGSRSTGENRVSRYTFTGAGTSTITQATSGTGVGANGYDGNNNRISTSDTLAADATGALELTLSKEVGSYAYLNLMRVDVVSARTPAAGNTAFQNPGFELGNFTNWSTVTSGAGAAATISGTPSHTGSYAARLGGGSLSLEQQISYVPTIGATGQKLSGWFYNPAAAGLHGRQAVHLELHYYSSSNALLGRFLSDSLVATSSPNTWTQVQATATIPAGTAYVRGAAVWRNPAGAAGSTFFDDLLLEPYEAPVAQNPFKLTFVGSSVAYGTGATNERGYNTLYAELLARRYAAGLGGPWVTANVAVPGNNTIDVLNRFKRDVLPENGRYVMIGLALGNEGIVANGQAAFDQFRTNLVRLIDLARANGLVPIINCGYTRNDYSATQYAFTRRMNLFIQGWNVPSVNLLGGVDDGNGRWATGYWSDALHPNDRGHAEFSYTMVPSLLDALHAGKSLPTRRASSGITLTKTPGTPTKIVRFEPEALVHPFTHAVRFRTAGPGQLVQVLDSAGLTAGTIRVAANGVLVYNSAKGQTITGSMNVADNRWHKLVLTHYYARGATQLYVDSVREGNVAERLRPTRFDLGGSAAPTRVQFRDLFFYRAGLNQDEVFALAADSLLKGSLEIYAPLDGGRTVASDSLVNLGQSTNTVRMLAGPVALSTRTSTTTAQLTLYPNPTTGELHLLAHGNGNLEGTPTKLYDTLGRLVLSTRLAGGKVNIGSLKPGVYALELQTAAGLIRRRVVRQGN